jgi:hypothetical protein
LLRIFLWKIGFEWTQLKRVLWPRAEEKAYYFAFGANLSVDVLERRKIKVFEDFDYILENAALRFSQSGFYKNHGYASADPIEGEVTYGKMYLILKSDAARMDYFEGLPFIAVHDKVFQKVNGLEFFYYRANNPREGLKPTKEYLNYLINAYESMPDVPKPYIETLASTKVLDKLLPQDQTGKYVSNISAWPRLLHPMLTGYERACLWLVNFLWNRSVFQRLIRS